MDVYQENLHEEKEYLARTLEIVRRELEQELTLLSERKGDLLKMRKEMWDNTVHFSTDFEKMTEINQYLATLSSQTASYGSTLKQIEKYKRVLSSPLFWKV